VIKHISTLSQDAVFLLWGAYAQSKLFPIDNSKHLILKSPHPSSLSGCRGCLGSKPFSKINTYLLEKNKTPIERL
jgi:uracil-DNA glycosylase